MEEILSTEAIGCVKKFKRWLRPKPDDIYPVVITPYIMSFISAMYMIDLLWSYLLCHRIDIICSDVFALPWGGFFIESVKDNPGSLFTYSIHHLSLTHLLANLIMTWFIYSHLEYRLGSLRIAIGMMLSCVGGSLLWWLWGVKGTVVVGFSGVAYAGLLIFVGEQIMHWREIDPDTDEPRSHFFFFVIVIGVIITFVVEAVWLSGIAILAHLGGAVSGLCYSLLFLPKFKREVWEYIIMGISALVFTLQFIILPCVLFFLPGK